MICSILGAGLAYSAWLAVILVVGSVEEPAVDALLWLTAPPATALGFTAGAWTCERISGSDRPRFWSIFIWPLVGCALGAAVVYPFGPMLIVFGMFFGGAASVLLREIMLMVKDGQG